MRYLPVSKLYISDSRRWIKSAPDRLDFICFDTETYEGACKLITDSEGRFELNPDFETCIRFMFFRASKSHYRAFYNIDFDISAIMKLISKQDEKYLVYENDDKKGKMVKVNRIDFLDALYHGKEVYYKDYRMFYIRKKFFKLAKGHKTVYITDLFSMFHTSLNKASKDFLDDEKIDVIDSSKLNTDNAYWNKNLKDIIKYCIKDSKLTARLGNKLKAEIQEVGLQLPRFMTSAASLSKQYFRYNCHIAGIKQIPDNILDIAVQTYYGGRFEVLKRGYFNKLYCYDINSAYPEAIANLPSLKYGRFKKVQSLSKKEIVGFYKVLLDIPEGYISPFLLRLKNAMIIFPHGKFGSWITWYEADLLRPYIKRLYYGYEYYPSVIEYKPFNDAIAELYKKKSEYKGNNDIWYLLVKLTMNALYGCFIERHKKLDNNTYTGILFNPIYASMITAKTRWQLINDVKKKDWNNIVAFHTDSIISTKPLKLPMGDKIGQWNLEAKDKGVILMSGVYQIGSKVRRRGFSGKTINWLKLLKENRDKDYIEIPYTHVIKMAESLKRWKDTDKVNKFIQDYRKVRINTDKKRNWNDSFKNCQDVLSRNISSKTVKIVHFSDAKLF